MKLGTLDIKKAYFGTLELTNNNAFIGTVPVIDEIRAVKFTASQVNSTIELEKLSPNQTLEYSTDGNNWTSVSTATTITLANSGDSCYIRGILTADNNTSNYTQFKMTGKIAVSGNCNYLWNYENPDASLKRYCGFRMFQDCTSLTSAPKLPAITLATSCYSNMFYGCTSLATAPELPTTTLAEGCYAGMFYDCISLAMAPELPATTLTDRCYNAMFSGCTSLTTAPELSATALVYNCYSYMFYDCSNLNYIKCLATDISASSCTTSWTYGVSAIGTFIKHPLMTDWQIGAKGIPSGWAVENNMSNDEIWYKSSNGEIIIPYKATSLPTVISNTYSQGMGTIKFTDNITSIGGSAFYGCDTLSSITLPNTVTNIGNQAFGGCLDLTVINIPNSVTSIGNSAFYNCFSLPSISIPNSIRSIGDWAFQDCSVLSSIYYRGTIAEWNSVTKGAYWNDNIPATVVHCTDGDVSI